MRLPIGTRVRLSDYSGWSDYKEHADQEAVVMGKVAIGNFGMSFDTAIKWEDDRISHAHSGNLVIVGNPFGKMMDKITSQVVSDG